MLRWFVVVVLLGSLLGAECVSLSGCAKQALPDITVRAASTEELAAFRAELGDRFTAEELKPFDLALQELQLDAMNHDVASAAAREQHARAAVNGKTVREALVLGWLARRARLLAEIQPMAETLERDLQTRTRYGADTPVIVTNRIQNVQDILARLRRDLLAADEQIAALGYKR